MYIYFFTVLLLYASIILLFFNKQSYSFSISSTNILKAILSVILILVHSNMYIESPFLLQFKALGAPIVSIFLFISGYGLINSYISKGEKYFDAFFTKRIWHILKPFILINVIFSIYLYIVNNGIPDNFFTNILSGTLPVFTSWYVVVLVLQYVLFYVIFKFLNLRIKNKMHLLTILTIFQILAFYFINYGRCWWVSTLAFSVGMYYRVYIEKVNAIITKKIFKLSYLPIGCVFIIDILKLNIEMLYSLTYIVIPLLVIIPLCFYKDFKINKIIGFLSSISYEIYLIHICVFSMLRNRFIYIESTYLYVLLTIIITILLAYPVHKVCNLKFWKSNNE